MMKEFKFLLLGFIFLLLVIVLIFSFSTTSPHVAAKTEVVPSNITFSEGWYDWEVEQTTGRMMRFAAENASLYIQADKNGSAFLNITMNPYIIREITIFLNGRKVGSYVQPHNIFEEIVLQNGTNEIKFQSLGCAIVSTEDTRCLSFGLYDVNIIDLNSLLTNSVIYGSGWYDWEVEQTTGRMMRFAGGNATFYIKSNTTDLLADITILPYKIQKIRTFINNENAYNYTWPYNLTKGKMGRILRDIRKGINKITFVSDQCEMLQGDGSAYRCLGFSVYGINITAYQSRYNAIETNLKRYTSPFSCETCNFILISIDTLRASHTGFMGYSRNTTHYLDSFAEESVTFDNAFVQFPSTTPSHTSIFTSLYASQHGTLDENYEIPTDVFMLPEIMEANGYHTVGFVGDGSVSAALGFSRGFELYDDNQLLFSETVPKAINWIEANKEKKFFLFLHGYEAHAPYGDSEFADSFVENYNGKLKDKYLFEFNYLENVLNRTNLSEDDINYIQAKYDGDVKQADMYIGALLEKVRMLNLSDKTIIIVFSDHGEYLGETHPNRPIPTFGHGGLYDEVLHQILLIKNPKIKTSGRVKRVVSSIDIAPTILELAGIGKFTQFRGKSLFALMNESTDDFAISEDMQNDINSYNVTIRTADWKLIVRANGVIELYDITSDKNQTRNIAVENPAIVAELLNHIERTVKYRNITLLEKRNYNEALLENLKRLGYVS